VADIVSKTVDVAVTVDARLAEQHTGRIAGLTFEEARSVQPVPEGGFRTYVPIPGGESLYDQLSRVMHFYADLLDHHMGASALSRTGAPSASCLALSMVSLSPRRLQIVTAIASQLATQECTGSPLTAPTMLLPTFSMTCLI